MITTPRTRRTAALWAAVSLLFVSLPFLVAEPARAKMYEPMEVTEDQTVRRDFPAIPGQDPANRFNRPSNCINPPTQSCDVVPLRVVVPQGRPADYDFQVRVTALWDTSTQSDIDLFIWEDPETPAPVSNAQSANHPETAVMRKPTKGKYQVVIINNSGINPGYQLKIQYVTGFAPPPFEQLDPERQQPPPAGGGKKEEPPPRDLSDEKPVALPAAPPAPAPEPAFGVEEVVPAPDADFDVTQLPAGAERPDLAGGAPPAFPSLADPEPPSALEVAVWMGVIPFGLVGGLLFFLFQRRPVALSV